jgi:hypothetical protein
MRFCVKVPVLSEQIAVVDPSVSTVYIFFTKTKLSAKIDAASPKDTVTVAMRPSGILETIIPILKVKLVNMS